MIASVYSFVDALPPRSPVIDLPSAIVYVKRQYIGWGITNSPARTERAALSILSAYSLRFMCLPAELILRHSAVFSHIPEHHERREKERGGVRQTLAYKWVKNGVT